MFKKILCLLLSVLLLSSFVSVNVFAADNGVKENGGLVNFLFENRVIIDQLSNVSTEIEKAKKESNAVLVNTLMKTAAHLLDVVINSMNVAPVKTTSYDVHFENVHEMTNLGDSTVFGYWLKDTQRISDLKLNEYRSYSQYSYPGLLKKRFALNNNQINQLGLTGLRTIDQLNLLGLTENTDSYFERYISRTKFKQISPEAMREDIKASIQRSDLVTVGLGTNDLGTYLGRQLGDIIDTGEPMYSFNWSIFSSIKNKMRKTTIDSLSSIISAILPETDLIMVAKLAEVIAYIDACLSEKMPQVFDRIHEINPQAKIMIMGIMNPMNDLVYQLAGTDSDAALKIGHLLSALVSRYNAFLRDYALSHSGYCCFVNGSEIDMLCYSDPEYYEVINLGGENGIDRYAKYMDTLGKGDLCHASEAGHYTLYMRIIKEALNLDAHIHQLTYHDAIPATCSSTGMKEYWSCDGCLGCESCTMVSGCGKIFADQDGKTEILKDDLVAETDLTMHQYDQNGICQLCGHVDFIRSVGTGLNDNNFIKTIIGVLGLLILCGAFGVVIYRRRKNIDS